jgi:hypothetical protein
MAERLLLQTSAKVKASSVHEDSSSVADFDGQALHRGCDYFGALGDGTGAAAPVYPAANGTHAAGAYPLRSFSGAAILDAGRKADSPHDRSQRRAPDNDGHSERQVWAVFHCPA